MHDNRRRAGLLCAAPGVTVGVIIGIVLVALGLPLIGLAALVVIAVAFRPGSGGSPRGRWWARWAVTPARVGEPPAPQPG